MAPPTKASLDSRPRTRSTAESSEKKSSETPPSNAKSQPRSTKITVNNDTESPTTSSTRSHTKSTTDAAATPRISKVRKALYMDFENASLAHLNRPRLAPSKTSQPTNEPNSRVPPFPWTNPLPPPSFLSSTAQQATRRSQRLIHLKNEPWSTSAPKPCEQSDRNELLSALDQAGVHSDYGTASENSFTMRLANRGKRRSDKLQRYQLHSRAKRQRIRNCGGENSQSQSQGYESDLSVLSDNLSDLALHEYDGGHLSSQPWESDDDQSKILSEKTRKVEEWDCAIDLCIKYVSYRGIHCLIPLDRYQLPSGFCESVAEGGSRLDKRKSRLMGSAQHQQSSLFGIQTFNNFNIESTLAKKGLRVISASPVISLEPRGTKFSELYPVAVSIPLEVYPSDGDEIYCLYSQESNETSGELKWCVHPNIEVVNGPDGNYAVTFETIEFCYFAVVIREQSLIATKQIRSRIGGKLVVPDSMIEINFPKSSVPEDILAKVKVHLDTELSLPVFLEDGFEGVCLASPILLLEPHGRDFSEGVTIQLPIPDYDAIISRFGSVARLTIWESRTDEHQAPDWKLLDVDYTVIRLKQTTAISFRVAHFSFFRAVWDLISASLYEAKVGVSYFYPYMSFPMKCQANMEENSERNSFGLEVICYRSDKTLPLPEFTNYSYRVGAALKPKLVKPGRIIVRLKSLFFEADVDAGEDPNLEKEEEDFKGRDFEMQYACKFKPDNPVDRGTFGKVIVKRFLRAGNEEALFEFNLQKSGQEGQTTPNDHDLTDRWSIVALKELAGNLFITDGDNWKEFATQIGFTKREVKLNLKNSADPFVAMIQLYRQRGGTPDEFVKVLYTVHRDLKINGTHSPTSTASKSSHDSSGRGSLPGKFMYGHGSLGSDSDTSGTQISQDSLLSGTTRKRSNPSVNRSGSGSNDKHKRKKILKFSDVTGDKYDGAESSSSRNRSTSPESDGCAHGSARTKSTLGSENHRKDLTKLGPTFLWELSSGMDTLNWRALGRSLGIEEPVLLNIEHSYKSSGFRECAYQTLLYWKEKFPKQSTFGTLYSALRKENMNGAAKKMLTVRSND